MSIIELTEPLIEKIKGIYPTIDIENLRKKVSSMRIVETDVGEKSPIKFDQGANVLSLNKSELENGNYDLSYYMTTFLLLMTKDYDVNLQGLRTGYFAGMASNLVGNVTKETENEVEPGIDLFESLRAGIADLSSKVGPEITCDLCESKNVTDFMERATAIGLENPEHFLAPYNYLALNFANLNEEQAISLAGDITKNNVGLSIESGVKTI